MPGTVVRFVEPLVAELVEDPEDRASVPLGPGEVRLRTLYSGISAGRSSPPTAAPTPT